MSTSFPPDKCDTHPAVRGRALPSCFLSERQKGLGETIGVGQREEMVAEQDHWRDPDTIDQ